MKTFTAKLNGRELTLRFDAASNHYELDGQPFSASVSQITPGRYSIVLDGASLDVRVAPAPDAREAGTRYSVQVQGEEIAVEVADPRKWQRGGGAATVAAHGRGSQRITAPMPGKVVRVLVAEGQAVESGQGLVVIEAMKMQNEIRSPKTGTVGKLAAAEGQAVAAGQALLVVE